MRKVFLLAVFVLLLAAVPAGAAPPRRGVLGDVNGDGLANSTDFLIILSADVGISTPYVRQYCPMNCGDVNRDGLVNSTDALIVLTYDAGLPVKYPVGRLGCPLYVWQPPACFVR